MQLIVSQLLLFISLGEECDIDINECDSNPCHHAGTCLDQPNGYTCHCPHGWVGANCEIRKFFCLSAIIFNLQFSFTKKGMLTVPSPVTLRGSAAWVGMPPASQCHTFAPTPTPHILLLPLLPESEGSPSMGWECADVIQSSLLLLQPKMRSTETR